MGLVGYLTKLPKKVNLRKVLIDVCVVALLIALGFAAKPAYRAFRGYRTDRSLEAAKVAASREDWITARDKARSVLLVRRNDFAAFRIWTRALIKLGEPRAYLAAAQLMADPRATREDRLEALRYIVSHAPQAVALSLYNSLPKDLSGQASFRAAIIPLLIQRGAIDVAEKGLREVAQAPVAPDVRLELLHALCCQPSAQRVAEARRIFADLVADQANTEALAALLLLGAAPGGLAPGDPLPDLPEWLARQTKATASHRLLGMDPALAAQPESAEHWYQTASERFLASDPQALGSWLLRHGQAEMAVRILADPAKSNPDAYLCRLRALLVLQWKSEIEEALAKPPAAVDPVEFEIVQARFAALRGDSIAANAAWTRAMNRAVFDTTRNRFIEVAAAANGCHAREATENAWVAAVRLGWGPLPMYRDLLPLYDSLATQGRSEDLLAVFRSLLSFEPFNPDLQHNFCYMALIHGLLTPAQVSATMTKLVGQRNQPGYHSTLMLAEMLAGRPADALTCLPKFRNSKSVVPMMKTALEGTARILVGETETGTALLKEVDWRSFMPQERIVFRNLLVKFKISGLPLPELETPKCDTNPEETPAWRKAIERLADPDHLRHGDNPDLTPAWRKAVERPEVPDKSKPDTNPDQSPAWRKAVERLEKDRGSETLPPLPTPPVRGAKRSATRE